MAITALGKSEIEAQLAAVPDWQYRDESLQRDFRFADFNQAFAFMTAVALDVEKADHHPEWFNVYNRVEIRLTTHDCKAVSQRDFDLAVKIDQRALALQGG